MRFGVLVLIGFVPLNTEAQASPPPTQPPQRALGGVSKNTPDPVKTETRIAFTVGNPPACADQGRQYTVTMTIYNVLAQPYATPVLQKGAGDAASGRPLSKLRLACGEYTAYWNGKGLGAPREPAPGVYRYTLEVDGRVVATRTMTVAK